MRTLLLVGIASVAAMWADTSLANQHTQTRVERRVIVTQPGASEDTAVYQNGADRTLTESDYRGRWQGEWHGTWEDADGRRYNGTYEGTYVAPGNGAPVHVMPARVTQPRGPMLPPPPAYGRRLPPPPVAARDYREERGYQDYRDEDAGPACRQDNGTGGAALGAVVGGLAGNRIAGRGNRTAGTLIGAGTGAIVGMAVDRAEDNAVCGNGMRPERRIVRHYDERNDRDDRGYRHGHDGRGSSYHYEGGYPAGYYTNGGYVDGPTYVGGGEGYAQSYGYTPGTTTTIIIPGQPVIIEETETTYETVSVPMVTRARVAPRRVVHHAAPRRVVRCTCR